MNLKNRLSGLQRKMNIAMRVGASRREIAAYESELKQLLVINDWFRSEFTKEKSWQKDKNGRWYFVISNNSGFDFEYVSATMCVLINGKAVDRMEIRADNLMNYSDGKMYASKEFPKGWSLSVDGESISYLLVK